MNKKAKYAVRAVKYFFYFSIIFSLIVAALRITGLAGGNLTSMFKDGLTSLMQIAALFAVVSIFYPKLGFNRRQVKFDGDLKNRKSDIVECMRSRGYSLESEEEGRLTFRLRSKVSAFCKMLEDRITLTGNENGFEVEGLTKDVVRIAGALEYRLRTAEETE